MELICLNCGCEFEGSLSNDELGWHSVCPECECSFDVDIERFLIPRGTKVRFHGDRIGIVDWNDEEVTEEFENINYCICPIEFINEEYWSDYYVWLLRDDFEIVEE